MRRVLCCVVLMLAAGVIVSLTASAAVAQTSTKEPVIDSAPTRVDYARAATVSGHLRGWVSGDVVSLQRKTGDSWATIRTRSVDGSGRVAFDLSQLWRTARYRLLYVDPASEVTTTSESRKISVAPKLTLRLSRDNVMQGGRVTAYGRLTPGPGRYVNIQHRAGGRWRTVGTAYERDGRYALRFEAKPIGARRIRAVFKGDEDNLAARSKERLRVYDPAVATWYGPGLYGNRTACGQTLKGGTLGVAHRSLPCGTEVAVLYEGRTIVVPVIDRGPYSHADWDLTQETAERLGFEGTDTIGVDARRN